MTCTDIFNTTFERFPEVKFEKFQCHFKLRKKKEFNLTVQTKIPAHIYLYLIQNFHRAGETITRTQQKFLWGLPWWDFCFVEAVDRE